MKLAFNLPLAAAEPAFSYVSRIAAANGYSSSVGLCRSLEIRERDVFRGTSAAVSRLAEVTEQDFSVLLQNTPENRDRYDTILGRERFRTRSIRKSDMRICPVCWLEAMQPPRSRRWDLSLTSYWLPRSIYSCEKHAVRLVPLPYDNYASCYDTCLRAVLKRGWLNDLERRIEDLKTSEFERAVLGRVVHGKVDGTGLCSTQIDALDQWCTGLGFFLECGFGSTHRLNEDEKRAFREVGFEVTSQGREELRAAIDAGLVKHCIPLSRAWFVAWARHSSKPGDRQVFREFVDEIVSSEGKFHLMTQLEETFDHKQARLISNLQRQTRWSRSRVAKALSTEKLLGSEDVISLEDWHRVSALAEQRILQLATSLNTTQAQTVLNMGSITFRALSESGQIRRLANTVFPVPRYDRSDLEAWLALVMKHTGSTYRTAPQGFFSITDASRKTQVPATEILALLQRGALKCNGRKHGVRGYRSILVSLEELLEVLRVQKTR